MPYEKSGIDVDNAQCYVAQILTKIPGSNYDNVQ